MLLTCNELHQLVEHQMMISMEMWISSRQSMAPSLTGLITTPTKRSECSCCCFSCWTLLIAKLAGYFQRCVVSFLRVTSKQTPLSSIWFKGSKQSREFCFRLELKKRQIGCPTRRIDNEHANPLNHKSSNEQWTFEPSLRTVGSFSWERCSSSWPPPAPPELLLHLIVLLMSFSSCALPSPPPELRPSCGCSPFIPRNQEQFDV